MYNHFEDKYEKKKTLAKNLDWKRDETRNYFIEEVKKMF